MSVDFAALDGAELEPLRSLVGAWEAVHGKAVDTRGSFDDVTSRLDPSDGWQGEANAASRIRGGELLDQVLAGITEAHTIKGILDDAVTRFETAQEELHAVVGSLAGVAELGVNSRGTVTVNRDAVLASASGSDAEALEVWEAHKAEYQSQIDAAVEAADTADREVSAALRFAGETEDGEDTSFNADALGVEELVQMRADAERATALLGTDPAELSREELRELNELLADNSEHPYFATAFMNGFDPNGDGSGPQRFIERYGELALHTWSENDPAAEDIMSDLQANLGHTLATATDPDKPVHLDPQWVDGFMEEGMRIQQLDDSSGFSTTTFAGGPYGYEVIAPLLRHGVYHEDFIVPVTEHMVRADAAMEPYLWTNFDEFPNPFDPRASGNGHHPLSDAMVALDNNPAAAAAFFAAEGEGAYPDANYVWGGRELEPVEGSRVDWMLDRVQDTEGSDVSVNYLGNALESASTGVPSGDTDAIRVPPSEENARVASAVFNYVGHADNVAMITGTDAPLSPLNDNLADITVNYMPDVHTILGNQAAEEVPNSWAVPPHENTLDVDPAVLQLTLERLGSDPGAALRIATGSEVNGSLQLAIAMERAPTADTDTYASAMSSHAVVMGHLDAGELHEIVADYEAQRQEGGGIPWADLVSDTATNAAGVTAGVVTENPWVGAGAHQVSGHIIDWVVDPFRAETEPDPGPGEDVRDAGALAREEFGLRLDALATAILADQGHALTDVLADQTTYADRVTDIVREVDAAYEDAKNRATDTRQEGG